MFERGDEVTWCPGKTTKKIIDLSPRHAVYISGNCRHRNGLSRIYSLGCDKYYTVSTSRLRKLK